VLLLRSEARADPHAPEFKIKSLARKLSKLVTAMTNPNLAQKSRFTHAEEHEPDLDATVWVSQTQRMLHNLPQGNQTPKHLHLASLYDAAHFPRLDDNAKKAAEAMRNVSFPRSRSGQARKIGDMPASISWHGDHKGTGFDPKPNTEEWKVCRHNRLCTQRLAGVGAGDRGLYPGHKQLPAGP
jgi:hypothetical protein